MNVKSLRKMCVLPNYFFSVFPKGPKLRKEQGFQVLPRRQILVNFIDDFETDLQTKLLTQKPKTISKKEIIPSTNLSRDIDQMSNSIYLRITNINLVYYINN